ncbi:MAG: agmatine deiminase [Lachnospiraceae bacterium]|nr:agmatine deiminase [Lachnospiraceae bacterium]
MKLLQTVPAKDGFLMPAEWEKHQATVMIWPVRPGSWRNGAGAAQEVFSEIARFIATGEKVYMLAGQENYRKVSEHFAEDANIRVLEIETDDAWARDMAPTFVRRGGVIRGISWQFNAWGGEVNGLYTDYVNDDMAAERICEELGLECYDAWPFVLEGGAIHTDGEGTLLVTESCLLGPGRNPTMSRSEIEQRLKDYVNCEKVIWLPCGIYNDETDGHIDNICAFVRPGEVVLATCEDETDPQYAMSRACLDVLQNETDAKGRKIRVHELPVPGVPVCVTEEEVSGYDFAPGEDEREVGERLAASYVNYYVCNAGILVPQFGDVNDEKATAVLRSLYPGKTVYPIMAREILLGGGNIHCITQQIPAPDR